MDPISLILAALVAGATKTAGDVAKDAYDGLKALIKRKFADNERAKMALDEYEKDPETGKALLKKKLTETKIDEHDEIFKVAQKLMEQLHPQEAAEGKFNVQISGGEVKGFTQQNTGTINQNFS